MKETILSLEKGAMERWRNGDPWGWAEISAEDVTYVEPGLTKPIIGLEEYKAYLKQFEGKVCYQGSEFIDSEVVVIGDTAVLSYNYRCSVRTPEGTIVSRTPWNSTEVYFRRNDQWRIVHTHWSYVKHKLPESVEVPLPIQLSKQGYEGVLGEIMALESAAMERWRKGDPWGFIGIYAPDVTYFDTGTPQRLNGLDALRAELAQRGGENPLRCHGVYRPQNPSPGEHGGTDIPLLLHSTESGWFRFEQDTLELQRSLHAD
jgi:ketosteroid isomerase-like protein